MQQRCSFHGWLLSERTGGRLAHSWEKFERHNQRRRPERWGGTEPKHETPTRQEAPFKSASPSLPPHFGGKCIETRSLATHSWRQMHPKAPIPKTAQHIRKMHPNILIKGQLRWVSKGAPRIQCMKLLCSCCFGCSPHSGFRHTYDHLLQGIAG